MHVTLNLSEVCQAIADAAVAKAGLKGTPGARDASLVSAPGHLVLDLRKPLIVSFIDGPECLIEIGFSNGDSPDVDRTL